MSTELEFLKKHSLSSLVRRELEKLILDGEFAPGERLNEYALATRFSVSRGPIREACRALAEKGLLELIPNRGVFMRKIDEDGAASLYDVRAGLFAAAVRLLATKITAEELAVLDDLLKRMDDAAASQSLDEYYPLNLEFHDSLMRFAGNSRLQSLYGELIRELHLFRERALLHDGGLQVSNAEHSRIVEALRTHDAAAATEEAFNHVLSGKVRMAIHDTHPPK
jgi:DNA-binding GntR family transcriptional regulator